MKSLLLLALLASQDVIAGEAAFSHRVESAAQVRGIELRDQGCALVDCSLLGRRAWVFVGGEWVGPLTSVDCAARHDRAFVEERDRIIDLPWALWERLGLPLMPVPVIVAFEEPPPVRWN